MIKSTKSKSKSTAHSESKKRKDQKPVKKVESESESESESSDDSDSDIQKVPIKKQKSLEKQISSDSGSDSSSDSDSGSNSDSDSSSDSSSDDEKSEPAKKKSKKEEDSSSSESSDSDSDDSDSDSDEEKKEKKSKPDLDLTSKKRKESPMGKPTKKQKTQESSQPNANQGTRIIVKGVSFDATEDDFRDYFKECGEVISVNLPKYPDSGRSKGIAFIEFAKPAEAQTALSYNGEMMMNRYLVIEIATKQLNTDKSYQKKELSAKPPGCNTVFIGNLSWNTTEESLRSYFEECGEVAGVRIAIERESGRSKGFGHVEFVDPGSVDAAIQMTGTEIDGRPIRVDYSQPRANDGGGRSSFGGNQRNSFGGGDRRGGFGGDRRNSFGGRGGRGTPRGSFGGRGGSRGGRGGFNAPPKAIPGNPDADCVKTTFDDDE